MATTRKSLWKRDPLKSIIKKAKRGSKNALAAHKYLKEQKKK